MTMHNQRVPQDYGPPSGHSETLVEPAMAQAWKEWFVIYPTSPFSLIGSTMIYSGHIPMTPVTSALHRIKPLTAFRSQLLKVGTQVKTGSCLSFLASGSRGALVKASLTQALCTQTGHMLGAPLLRLTCSRRRYGMVCSSIELRI